MLYFSFNDNTITYTVSTLIDIKSYFFACKWQTFASFSNIVSLISFRLP